MVRGPPLSPGFLGMIRLQNAVCLRPPTPSEPLMRELVTNAPATGLRLTGYHANNSACHSACHSAASADFSQTYPDQILRGRGRQHGDLSRISQLWRAATDPPQPSNQWRYARCGIGPVGGGGDRLHRRSSRHIERQADDETIAAE